MSIAIVDYGVGNLSSLECSFRAIGQEVLITGDREMIHRSDKIILPGVGAFRDAIGKLRESGLDSVLVQEAEEGKKILGICLGMQLLFEKSFEYGEYEGLGLIPGSVKAIGDIVPESLKIPHMGWNELHFTDRKSELFRYLKDREYMYFVHSYHASECDPYITATTEYGAELTAAVERDNVYGCQFHPEKSGNAGLSILRAFSEMA